MNILQLRAVVILTVCYHIVHFLEKEKEKRDEKGKGETRIRKGRRKEQQ